jgi:hypothetical protein
VPHKQTRARAVKVCERFVKEENALAHRQSRSHDKALLLSARKRPGICRRLKFHHLTGIGDPPRDESRRPVEVLTAKGRLVSDRDVDYLAVGILQDAAYATRSGSYVRLCNVPGALFILCATLTFYLILHIFLDIGKGDDLAASLAIKQMRDAPYQDTEQGGLAAAGQAAQNRELAVVKAHVAVSQHSPLAVGVAKRVVPDLQGAALAHAACASVCMPRNTRTSCAIRPHHASPAQAQRATVPISARPQAQNSPSRKVKRTGR